MPDAPTTLARCTQAWSWLSHLTIPRARAVGPREVGSARTAATVPDPLNEDGLDPLMGMPAIPHAGGRHRCVATRPEDAAAAWPGPGPLPPGLGTADAAARTRARLTRGLRAIPHASPRRPGLAPRTPDLSWLRRDLVAFDLETTGVNQHYDQAIEAGFVRITPQGRRSGPFVARLRPSRPICPGAFRAHGISAADLVDERRFVEVAPWIRAQLADADLVGYNCRAFDCNLLRNEFARIGQIWPAVPEGSAGSGPLDGAPPAPPRVIDVYRIFRHHVNEHAARRASRRGAPGKFTLQHQAYPFYCGTQLVGAHNAGHDAMAALDIFLAQLDAHDLPRDLQRIDEAYNTRGRRLRYARRDDVAPRPLAGHVVVAETTPRPSARPRKRAAPEPTPAVQTAVGAALPPCPQRLATGRPRRQVAPPVPALAAPSRTRRRLALVS